MDHKERTDQDTHPVIVPFTPLMLTQSQQCFQLLISFQADVQLLIVVLALDLEQFWSSVQIWK